MSEICSYCFGPIPAGTKIVVKGRPYHRGHEKLDKPLPRIGDDGPIKVGGRGGDVALEYNRTGQRAD